MEKYKNSFLRFRALVLDISEEYRGVAWALAHREGLEAAIGFCLSHREAGVMVAVRDCEELLQK